MQYESSSPSVNGNSKPLEIVITGLGVASPIGIGRDAFWRAMLERRSGVRMLTSFDSRSLPVRFGGEIIDFDPKQYVIPRKSLKVMSRDIQLGFTVAKLATADAGLEAGSVDPERLSVVFGTDMIYSDLEELTAAFRSCVVNGRFDFSRWGKHAMGEMFPLWLLKYLPNMSACHIGIAHDARGPNNSITLGEVSSLLALTEGMRIIERGQADVVVTGGASSRLHPTLLVWQGDQHLSHRAEAPAAASRPFDLDRDGMVNGEGAAAFVLESRQHAEARGANILASILGYASNFEPRANGCPIRGVAISSAIEHVLRTAHLEPKEIGHVNAHGDSTIDHDRAEASAIHSVLGEVPVTAPKSFFGNLGAATGAVEMAVSLIALSEGKVPVTLNYDRPDPACPVNVIHRNPLLNCKPTALLLNQAPMGQSVAVVISGPG